MVDGIKGFAAIDFENVEALKTKIHLLETINSGLSIDSQDEDSNVQIAAAPENNNTDNSSNPTIIDKIRQSLKIAIETCKSAMNKLNGTTQNELTDEQKEFIAQKRDFIANRIAIQKMSISQEDNSIKQYPTNTENWSDEDKAKLKEIASAVTDEEIEQYVLNNWPGVLMISKMSDTIINSTGK